MLEKQQMDSRITCEHVIGQESARVQVQAQFELSGEALTKRGTLKTVQT
jgi:hypothetical protein